MVTSFPIYFLLFHERIVSIIGEAALSAFFEVLFEKLTSSDVLKIFKQERLHADLKKWKTMLLKIRAVLDDKQVGEDLVG